MKLTPASRALAMMRCAVGSSAAPPNIMVPRQRGDTFSPLRPRFRYSTHASFSGDLLVRALRHEAMPNYIMLFVFAREQTWIGGNFSYRCAPLRALRGCESMDTLAKAFGSRIDAAQGR